MEIVFKDGQVIITLPRCVLALTRAQFIDAVKRGKAYRRREALAARQGPKSEKECDRQSQDEERMTHDRVESGPHDRDHHESRPENFVD